MCCIQNLKLFATGSSEVFVEFLQKGLDFDGRKSSIKSKNTNINTRTALKLVINVYQTCNLSIKKTKDIRNSLIESGRKQF